MRAIVQTVSRASVTVVQPAGTGIQVTLARVPFNNGQFALQWKDPNLFAGIVPEGQYRVSVHIPGYADALSAEDISRIYELGRPN